MADFKAKMHQIVCRLGLRPRPRRGSLQRSPRPPSWILGGLLLREGRRGEGRGGEGKGTPCSPVTPSSCHYILDKGLVLFSVSSDNSSGYSLLHTHETIHNDTRQTFTRRKTVRRPTCLTISTTLCDVNHSYGSRHWLSHICGYHMGSAPALRARPLCVRSRWPRCLRQGCAYWPLTTWTALWDCSVPCWLSVMSVLMCVSVIVEISSQRSYTPHRMYSILAPKQENTRYSHFTHYYVRL